MHALAVDASRQIWLGLRLEALEHGVDEPADGVTLQTSWDASAQDRGPKNGTEIGDSFPGSLLRLLTLP